MRQLLGIFAMCLPAVCGLAQDKSHVQFEAEPTLPVMSNSGATLDMTTGQLTFQTADGKQIAACDAGSAASLPVITVSSCSIVEGHDLKEVVQIMLDALRANSEMWQFSLDQANAATQKCAAAAMPALKACEKLAKDVRGIR